MQPRRAGSPHVVAMANTVPPIDTPERVAEARLAASNLPVSILQVAALTRGLEGAELVDIRKCIEAGAVAVGDDGRNGVSPRQLAIALAETAHLSRAVFVHPEDEEMIAQANATQGPVTRSPIRPAESETRAVNLAIRALVARAVRTPAPPASVRRRLGCVAAPRTPAGPCRERRGHAPSPLDVAAGRR